jgi:hypothetical protein
LYLLEPGDDALLAQRASAFLLRLRELVQFRAQFVESMSLTATLILVADKGGGAFGHPRYPAK